MRTSLQKQSIISKQLDYYVMADDFCKSQLPAGRAPGPKASLAGNEVITLVIFSHWARFRSERDFYPYAPSRLRPAFPALPRRSRFNRLARRCYGALAAFSRHHPTDLLQGQRCLYEALDSSAVPTSSAERHSVGWLPGQADIGWSNRLGWYVGFRLLLSINPQGVITGFGSGAARSGPGMAENYRNSMNFYRRHGQEYLAAGDYRQAAEKSWGVFASSVKSIAADYGMKISFHGSHGSSISVVSALATLAGESDPGDRDVLSIGISSARSLHQHFYENHLPADDVIFSSGRVVETIDLMQRRFASVANVTAAGGARPTIARPRSFLLSYR